MANVVDAEREPSLAVTVTEIGPSVPGFKVIFLPLIEAPAGELVTV